MACSLLRTRMITRFALLLLLFSSLLAETRAGAAETARRKVLIDQDAFGPGGSNLQAILFVVQSPDIEIVGVTIESGDGWQKENVAHTLWS